MLWPKTRWLKPNPPQPPRDEGLAALPSPFVVSGLVLHPQRRVIEALPRDAFPNTGRLSFRVSAT